MINWRLKRSRKAWKKKCSDLKRTQKRFVLRHETLQQQLDKTGKYLSKDGLYFLKMQLQLASKRSRGRRYSNELKSMALAIYYKGPRVYKFLSSIFALPSKSTLSLWLQGASEIHSFQVWLERFGTRSTHMGINLRKLQIAKKSCPRRTIFHLQEFQLPIIFTETATTDAIDFSQ
jgi:hypothetical protein